MLAYAFWHWPQPAVTQAAYVPALAAFHAVLSEHRPLGFLGSSVFRVGPAPWLPSPGGGYLDWYLLQDSAALDRLNEAAVSPACRGAHDESAHLAAGGTAGIYRLWSGELDANRVTLATWFAKPAGMTYTKIGDLLRDHTATAGSSAWGRQMVLGPTPEFCLLRSEPVALPGIPNVQETPMGLVWPAG